MWENITSDKCVLSSSALSVRRAETFRQNTHKPAITISELMGPAV
jgi:hypothetical protein